MEQQGLCITGCSPFPVCGWSHVRGKRLPKCRARAACSGSWEAMGEWLPVSCGGGRSMRRSGGQHHVLNPERKLLGEQRMSKMSRVGRVRSGLGQNKAQGSPAPAAPTPLPAGTETLLGEGSIRAEASPRLPTFRRAGRLHVPQFPSAEVCWVQQDGPRVLVSWGWPWRARLLCCTDAPEVLDGGWSLWGQEGAPITHESPIALCLNRQVPQVGPQHSAPLEQLWSLLESSGSVPGCCGE